MGRQPRDGLRGAFGHVTARGNRGQAICVEREDYARLEERLKQVAVGTGCAVYAYALMPNHLHLLVEVGEEPLGKMMQRLLTSHARYFNGRHGQSGHVFEGRYGWVRCKREGHLLELVRYIHLNPVRGGLCRDAAEWPWSSHRYYLGERGGEWTRAREGLGLFGGTRERAILEYRRFLREGIEMGPPPSWHPKRVKAALKGRKLEATLRRLSARLGVPLEQVRSSSRERQVHRARALLVWFATDRLGIQTRDLARALERVPASLSRARKVGEALVQQDTSLRLLLESPATQEAQL